MKKKLSTIVKGTMITTLFVLFTSPLMAQLEKRDPIITEERRQKITALVKPLKDKLDKQLSQDLTYKAYLEDVKKLSSTKSMDEKDLLTKKIEEKYLDYFKKAWAVANINESSYQQKIREIFPADIAKQIKFDLFLNFSILVSDYIGDTPLPLQPPDKCIDICTIATGEINGSPQLIADGGGSYGNCFLKVNSWSAVAGWNELTGNLRNNITIPGTLPDDDRKLRVKKSYQVKMKASSFTTPGVIGVARTTLITYKSYEDLSVMSPLLWRSQAERIKTINEEYLLEKKEVAKSKFYARTISLSELLITGSWSYTECTSIKWSICEQK